ncbi:flagellar biosynthetic protein FlhF [Candidatus Scalindua japonica]|uniref:Flagellar biosynthetic protein FlhF n=1 Tax=Candidatus Scalindua japonica TaxID=1284222 RepID=A0A286TVW6_9BACT|nr:hypothetical protein [Candidatus Scalindua japonica]GAX60030.1 flagellar biosynthetic protein FlhF [Candidatus Scalindua japonica]
MKIKSFIASTVQEALKSVKREMGDASIILETRNIEEGDIKSKAGQVLVEVIAAENVNDQNPSSDLEQSEARKDDQGGQDDSGDIHSELSDHLHTGKLTGFEDTTPPDRLNHSSHQVSTGEGGRVIKWIVDNKVKSSEPHLNHIIRKDSGNSRLLLVRNESKQLSAESQSGLKYPQMGNASLADHLLTADLIEMAGCSEDETPTTLVKQQYSDSNSFDWPGQSIGLFKQLRIQQVEDEHSRILINEVLDRLSKDEYDRMDLHCQMLRESIIHKIKISDSLLNNQDECKTMVFLGAAGTGKTTTILKLASDTKKRSDKEILLLSIRGNSAGKLKQTADRIGVTFKTVTSPRELREIGDKYGGSSHIFIDTPGISYLDGNTLSNLKGLLDEIPDKETHLVVSATMRYADIINLINKFTPFPIQKLNFTRVDETSLYGTLFSVAMETQIPLSWITDGQEIPEDIRPVTTGIVADMILQV